MSNLELVTTILSIVLTIGGSILGLIAKRSEKAKRYYEAYIDVERKIKELSIQAEKNYQNGDQKKKYVLSNIHTYMSKMKVNVNESEINGIIESIIDISKQINK
jgi:hypothetical protein